jgi:hypothetical protein
MSSGVPPPKRSQTGATGSSKVPTPPPRAKSFAFFSRDKNKKKLKTASISSYRLDTEEQKVKLEDWLVGRFGVSKAELKLVLVCEGFLLKAAPANSTRSATFIGSKFSSRTR